MFFIGSVILCTLYNLANGYDKVTPTKKEFVIRKRPQLEFLNSLWGFGTGEEYGYRTGPPGYIGWRNSFLGIDSWAP
jgi:hypothetical protein